LLHAIYKYPKSKKSQISFVRTGKRNHHKNLKQFQNKTMGRCTIQEHCVAKVAGGAPSSTLVAVANLDPAAEHFDYDPVFDVRDLVNVVRSQPKQNNT
jgi:hypothetical protein